MKRYLLALYLLLAVVCNAQDQFNQVNLNDQEITFKNLLKEAPKQYHIFKSSTKRLVLIPNSIAVSDFDTVKQAKKAVVFDFYTLDNAVKLKSIKGNFDTLFYLWQTYFNPSADKTTISKDYKNQTAKGSTYKFTFKKGFDGSWTIQNVS